MAGEIGLCGFLNRSGFSCGIDVSLFRRKSIIALSHKLEMAIYFMKIISLNHINFIADINFNTTSCIKNATIVNFKYMLLVK